MTASARSGSRAQKKAARPAEILEATFQEFLHKGYEAARVEDIAARLGISKGAVYFYFESKDVLFASMIRDLSARLMDGMAEEAAATQGPARDRLAAFVSWLYQRLTANPRGREILRFLLAEGRRFPDLVDSHYDEFIEPVFALCRGILADGVASGEFKPTAVELRPEVLLSPILATCFDLLMRPHRASLDGEALQGYLDALIQGIGAS